MYTIKIIPFQPEYRDDTIFCLLLAKDAIKGRAPRLNEDLLDVQRHYFDKGDIFYIALSDEGRVIGMLGTDTVSPTDMRLKRLYVRPDMKRRGIGGALLASVEKFARQKGVKTLHTRFSEDYKEAPLFYESKGFVEAERDGKLRRMIKSIGRL